MLTSGRSSIASATSVAAAIALSIIAAGCGKGVGPAGQHQNTTLTIGFGLATGTNPTVGMNQVVSIVTTEGLINMSSDGRPRPWLADHWSSSPDALRLDVFLRPSATFHDGTPVTASIVRDILAKQVPADLGEIAGDIRDIRAVSDREVEFSLRERSALLVEGLFDPIEKPGPTSVGTGPFKSIAQTGGGAEMRANEQYYLGKPSIDRIVVRPYPSVRSAWADMLRGQVDMLYDVGVDALDSLQRSSDVTVFTFLRPYAMMALLNTHSAQLRDPAVRRALNRAIDRTQLLSDVFRGQGVPVDSPVWPKDWAYDSSAPNFGYRPESVGTLEHPLRITCLLSDPSYERLALEVQKQLQAVGVDFEPEMLATDSFVSRVTSGNFDAVLLDAAGGPGLIPPYLYWHSGGRLNFAHYSNTAVDAALDTVRHAANDDEYKKGVAAFQRAIVDDPPAIFLVWSERARAVSRRFEVPTEPGVDILRTLRLWRPATAERVASRN